MGTCASFRSLALIFVCALAGSVHAQDGPYDPAFGSGGKIWVNVTGAPGDTGQRLIRLPNGNLFMVGSCGGYSCAAWLTPSGALATGFGIAGTGAASFVSFPGWPYVDDFGATDAAAFADGRIAVPATKAGTGGFIALLRADGTGLDAAAGNGAGYVTPPFEAKLARVTAQQQLIAVGETEVAPGAIVVARYDSTLHLDTSFGSGGSTMIAFSDGQTIPYGMTLQRDGKIVVVGTVVGSPQSLAIVRLTAGGNPDPDFGVNSDGRFQSVFGNSYGAAGLSIAQDKKGRLVFAGLARTNDTDGGRWLVNRLLSGGAVDSSFNAGHAQQFTINSSSNANLPRACCVALQSDNRIVVAGTMNRPGDTGKYFAMARFNENGSFDSTWGGGGQSYGDMSTQAPTALTDEPASMVVVPGGIVVAGYTEANAEIRFSAAGLRTDLLLAADFE